MLSSRWELTNRRILLHKWTFNWRMRGALYEQLWISVENDLMGNTSLSRYLQPLWRDSNDRIRISLFCDFMRFLRMMISLLEVTRRSNLLRDLKSRSQNPLITRSPLMYSYSNKWYMHFLQHFHFVVDKIGSTGLSLSISNPWHTYLCQELARLIQDLRQRSIVQWRRCRKDSK